MKFKIVRSVITGYNGELAVTEFEVIGKFEANSRIGFFDGFEKTMLEFFNNHGLLKSLQVKVYMEQEVDWRNEAQLEWQELLIDANYKNNSLVKKHYYIGFYKMENYFEQEVNSK